MVTQFITALTATDKADLRQDHVVTSHELCAKMLMENQRHVL